jgi:hypothetical protein
MIYEEEILISGVSYSVVFSDEVDKNYSRDYLMIIFKKEGNICDSWSSEESENIDLLCQRAVNYVELNSPNKFCFYTSNESVYELYKSHESSIINNYKCVEKKIHFPISIRISFYDRI